MVDSIDKLRAEAEAAIAAASDGLARGAQGSHSLLLELSTDAGIGTMVTP